jgi:uncharacterized protein YegP (UPF0339 family)
VVHFFYKDNCGAWRWTFWSANDEASCVSSEGYNSKQDALHGIALMEKGAPTARIYDYTTKTWS